TRGARAVAGQGGLWGGGKSAGRGRAAHFFVFSPGGEYLNLFLRGENCLYNIQISCREFKRKIECGDPRLSRWQTHVNLDYSGFGISATCGGISGRPPARTNKGACPVL